MSKNHFRLAFEREGGGSDGSCIEIAEKSTSGSGFDAREVVVPGVLKRQMDPQPVSDPR